MRINPSTNRLALRVVSLLVPASLIAGPVFADAISPRMENGDREYSTEKPNSEYYGRGPAGRKTEASELRMQGDQLMADGNYEDARKSLGKAVTLDPGDPEGHLMYARCITKILYSKKTVDEKLLGRCIAEWRLIAYHDADQLDQTEAKAQDRRLLRIAKALEKQKKEKEKQEALLAEKALPKDESAGAPSARQKRQEQESSPSDEKLNDE